MVVRHSELGLKGGTHIVHNWKFQDEQERLSCTEIDSKDLYKVAYQEDNHSWWVLKNVAPVVWHCFAGDFPQTLVLSAYAESEDEIHNSETEVFPLLSKNLKLQGFYLVLVSWEVKTNSFSGAEHQFVVSLDDETIGRCSHKWGNFDQYDSGFFLTLVKLESAESIFSVGHRVLEPTTVTVRRIRTAFLRLSET